jgi:hypothetical protein
VLTMTAAIMLMISTTCRGGYAVAIMILNPGNWPTSRLSFTRLLVSLVCEGSS